MITLRCTARAIKALGLHPVDPTPTGTSPLGDWYMNLIATAGGGLYLFVNERSLLSVVVPRGEPVLQMFVARVGNILSMIGVPNGRIEQELEHFFEVRIGRTTSKRILGAMNELAFHCQDAIDQATPRAKVSLSDLELRLATIPQATMGFRTASEVARELLSSPAKHGAV